MSLVQAELNESSNSDWAVLGSLTDRATSALSLRDLVYEEWRRIKLDLQRGGRHETRIRLLYLEKTVFICCIVDDDSFIFSMSIAAYCTFAHYSF